MLVLPNAWDAASARLIEAEGFPAIATTSAGVAASLGYPDGGIVPANEMIEAIARIARSVKLPVTADIEHAYGATPDAVADVVLRVIAAGAVGINLEDCVPGGTDLEPLALQVDKIKAIIKASTTAGVRIVINARTDGFLRGFGAAERGSASRSSAARRFSRRGPTACSCRACATPPPSVRWSRASAGRSTCSSVEGRRLFRELEALGVARVSLGSGPMRATLALLRDIARELKAPGTYASFTKHAMTFDEVNDADEIKSQASATNRICNTSPSSANGEPQTRCRARRRPGPSPGCSA